MEKERKERAATVPARYREIFSLVILSFVTTHFLTSGLDPVWPTG